MKLREENEADQKVRGIPDNESGQEEAEKTEENKNENTKDNGEKTAKSTII